MPRGSRVNGRPSVRPSTAIIQTVFRRYSALVPMARVVDITWTLDIFREQVPQQNPHFNRWSIHFQRLLPASEISTVLSADRHIPIWVFNRVLNKNVWSVPNGARANGNAWLRARSGERDFSVGGQDNKLRCGFLETKFADEIGSNEVRLKKI